MSKFSKGVVVICIDDTKPQQFDPTMFPNWIQKGKKYRVRDILFNDNIVTGILLEELVNPQVPIKLIKRWQEGAFAEWRFELAPKQMEEECTCAACTLRKIMNDN